MNEYNISIYWGEFSLGGVIVCKDTNAQSLKKRLLKHKGDFVEFTTVEGDLIRVRKSKIDGLYIYPINK